MVRISAALTRPAPERPLEGTFIINSELTPMAHSSIERGRATDLDSLISRTIDKVVRRSGALDTESLCLLAGEKAWTIRADLHFLDHDGALLDVSCLAVMIALYHFRRNAVTITNGQVFVHPYAEKVPEPLTILHFPILTTFAVFDRSSDHVVDPTFLEEQICEYFLTITITNGDEICELTKRGGQGLPLQEMLECTRKAQERSKLIYNFVQNKLKQDTDLRDKNMPKAMAANDRLF